jgi:hypothetical protein
MTSRYTDARARMNYAGTSPITRQSGKKKTVLARHVHNDRLIDALNRQAFAALRASPAPAPTTTSCAPAASATTPRSANSATDWPASCTAASRPPPPTPKPPHGHITNKIYKLLLDNKTHEISSGQPGALRRVDAVLRDRRC